MVLGLIALLLLYGGGRALDGLWPQSYKPNYGEATRYEAFCLAKKTGPFQEEINARRIENQRQYADELITSHIFSSTQRAQAETDSADFRHSGELDEKIVDRRNELLGKADQKLEDDFKEADQAYDLATKAGDDAAKPAAEAARRRAKQEASDLQERDVARTMTMSLEVQRALRELEPRGVFDEFFDYETKQVNRVTEGVLANNWTSGLAAADVRGAVEAPAAAAPTGVVAGIRNFFLTGPAWLVRYHTVYFVLFFILFLLVWAIFGGAIARIAAVHAARDEKIFVREALRFSTNKVLSFVFAPVIPLGIVLFIGLLLAAGGLLFYIPWVGPILAGALMVLALIGGVLITLVLIGTLGGLNLMYPTVAAEGSDSFDAISRSFSYVYARPWRMLFYTAVSIAYGAVTYLFVKLFIFLVLAVTHYFVGWWLSAKPGRWYSEMWPAPSFDHLPYVVNFTGLKFTEKTAAFLICFWNYLLIGLLGAFAISFYFSASSIIYFLMRREVDATELEDVFLEESDDDLSEPVPVSTGPTPADGPVTRTISLPQAAQAVADAPSPSAAPSSEGGTPAGETPLPG